MDVTAKGHYLLLTVTPKQDSVIVDNRGQGSQEGLVTNVWTSFTALIVELESMYDTMIYLRIK